MGNAGPDSHTPAGMSAAEIRRVHLPQAKGFGRGYDPHGVDEVIARCASTVELLASRLAATRSELAAARAEVDHLRAESQSERAMQLLKSAQAKADEIVTKAMAEQERAAEEARAWMEQARTDAATVRRENERMAQQIADEAAERTAALQQLAGERLDRLTIAAELAQQEIDGEARQLQNLRDTTRAQIEDFIDGVLDHLTDQYGQAHPLAAQAAAAAARRAAIAGHGPAKPPAGGRGRRAPRIAGRSSVPVESGPGAALTTAVPVQHAYHGQ